MADEFPAILQRGESVFTAAQTQALGSMIGSNTPPKIQINIENHTIGQVEKSQEQPRWDGDQWVIGVVLNAVNTDGSFKNILKAKLSA